MTCKQGLLEAAELADSLAKEEYAYRLELPINNEFNKDHERSLGAENALRALAQELRNKAGKKWF